ncbi:cyclic pyranopterin monophosphate synthase MoaC [Frigoribacterium sp. ACAM 257]|uniref:cyclic pyranopterin monophosphate synthase MoaC n=1 Tax=Frigoribacterium sp. ACAM 257 TaxID=2508998 RepID=UPI0011B98AA4|nr:cyclic pyranopterin monophosphate synthase MoaC [Frigoribacterium sp. ACAM 257]TWX37094.1 cyclic pyranopterin monophosphate synthase MoaC [Frigoribacterium sp. ACAM 257]
MSDDAHGAPPASAGQQPVGDLTHVRPDGSAHMVDVTGKAETSREAAAQAVLTTRPDVVARLVDGTLPKGEALGTARIAGIMAAKQTPALIPLCHPLPLGAITVDFETHTGAEEASVTVVARVRTRGVTGVEMEALTAATVAALTLFDMIKAVDHLAVIGDVKVLEKSGGKSGEWAR